MSFELVSPLIEQIVGLRQDLKSTPTIKKTTGVYRMETKSLINEQEYLTGKQILELFGVSRTTLSDWRRFRGFPPSTMKIAHHRLTPLQAVREWSIQQGYTKIEQALQRASSHQG